MGNVAFRVESAEYWLISSQSDEVSSHNVQILEWALTLLPCPLYTQIPALSQSPAYSFPLKAFPAPLPSQCSPHPGVLLCLCPLVVLLDTH